MSIISMAEHQRMIEEFKEQLEDLRSEKIAMAILLVRGAGGRVVVTESLALDLSATSYIQEDRDPATGDRIFTTWERPTAEGLH